MAKFYSYQFFIFVMHGLEGMFVYLDTETTGLSAALGDKIVEISIVGGDGEILLNTLVDPERNIPYSATNVHGITSNMCEGFPTIEELLPCINEIISGEKVVIYNSSYDIQFFPDRLSQANEILCAMRAYKKSQKTSHNRFVKLAKAAQEVGHQWSGDSHRSLPDTLACRSVWMWLFSNDQNMREKYAAETVDLAPIDRKRKNVVMTNKGVKLAKVEEKIETSNLANSYYDFFKYMDEGTIRWLRNEAKRGNTDIGTIIAAILKDAYFDEDE